MTWRTKPPDARGASAVWGQNPESTATARTACPDDFTGSGAYHPGALTGHGVGQVLQDGFEFDIYRRAAVEWNSISSHRRQ